MARVRCIRCQRATTRNRDGVCDACRGMASRPCPRCRRHNGLLTRAADGRFLCAECSAQVALSSSGLVRVPPPVVAQQSDWDEPAGPPSASSSSEAMPHCPLHPGSELIRTRMRDGSTRWTCSERNHDIENNWALCASLECKDNHGDTSLVDLSTDTNGGFECRNPQCPLVQRRRRVQTVVERKSEFCLACMDTEPAPESKCPNGHISYCGDCLPHLNPRQCGQCRMPIARAISPPPQPRPEPPRPPARRITSLCAACRQVMRLVDEHWECRNVACAYGRTNILFGYCQDCGGQTRSFAFSGGAAPRCLNPDCTARLRLPENAPPPARRITSLCPSCRQVLRLHDNGYWQCTNAACTFRRMSECIFIGYCQDCGRQTTCFSASAGVPPRCTNPNCTAPLLAAPPRPEHDVREPPFQVRSDSPPVFVAPPLSDILPGVVVPLPRAARRLDFGQSEEVNEDQAAAMVRLLGPPPNRARRPREEEDKKELEHKEEPAPQRRRLRHLWLYFGTGARGVRPTQGFVDGDIIISMREAPTMAMQEILVRERARIDVQFAMTTQESFAIVTLYQTGVGGGPFSNLTIDCIFDVPLDANSFIDSENVRLRYDESQSTIRYSNHAYTELFTLLARDAQLQRRTERTLRDLGFTSSS